jgi:hypothetical protein
MSNVCNFVLNGCNTLRVNKEQFNYKIINQEKRVFLACTKPSFLLIDNPAVELFFFNTAVPYQTIILSC